MRAFGGEMFRFHIERTGQGDVFDYDEDVMKSFLPYRVPVPKGRSESSFLVMSPS